MKISSYKDVSVIESNRLIALLNLIMGKHIRGWAGAYFAIIIKEGLDDTTKRMLLRHERQHIYDMEELGYGKFVKLYYKYNNSVGYNRNPFELRAREAELVGKLSPVSEDSRIKS